MNGKIAIIIASDWNQTLKVTSALHLAKRIYDVRKENSIDVLEVFLYAGGAKLLQSLPKDFANTLEELKQSNIIVKVCTTEAKLWSLDENARKYGVSIEFARDAFSRYAREGFSILTI